jgi:hypothetical protein
LFEQVLQQQFDGKVAFYRLINVVGIVEGFVKTIGYWRAISRFGREQVKLLFVLDDGFGGKSLRLD